MSTDAADFDFEFDLGDRAELGLTDNYPAVAGVAVLLGASLSAFYHIVDVVGGVAAFVVVVVTTLVAATALARFLRERTALLVSAVVLAGGLLTYFYSIPESQRALFTVGRVLADTGALLTGLSVLRLLNAEVWVLTLVPGPLFLGWYLALRGRYVGSVLVGGAVLGFLILTGDADLVTTLAGVLGAASAVGFGTVAERGGLDAQWDTVTLVLAVMVLTSASLSLVPGGQASPLFIDRGSPTIETNLVSNADRVGIVGSIRLSPKVRFSVEADTDEPHYWKTGTYDRYTGGGWVRTGEAEQYSGEVDGPPGSSQRLVQSVTAETEMNAIPAAWKPVKIRGSISRATEVTEHGGFRAVDAVEEGESYIVVSETPQYTTAQLRTAGTDYPEEVSERYLQLPESTPDRVAERTAEIIREADANNPYDAATAVETYLEDNNEYSLNVERPEANIADSFLFEMDAGYCVYYATTMVAMLRSQGIPARFATGYTPGERVDRDEWVVRGLDAHAWVEVYFPDVGWVKFDPTPGGPRSSAEAARLADARRNDVEGVDTNETGGPEWTPTPIDASTETTTTQPGGRDRLDGADDIDPSALQTGAASGPNGTIQTPEAAGAGGGPATPTTGAGDGGISIPSRETMGYATVALVGLVAGVRRLGLVEFFYRGLWLRYQRPTEDPDADVERAYRRLEAVLESAYRPRRSGETVQTYLSSLPTLDDRIHDVASAYERARYGSGVSREEADDVVETVDGVVRRARPLTGYVRRGNAGRRATRGPV